MKFTKYIVLLLCCVFLFSSKSYAFDKDLVHSEINKTASLPDQSLDKALRKIGILDGVNEYFTDANGKKKTVVDWLKQGGTEEDKPVSRTLNHFHDPTQEWVEAELWGWLGASSVVWAQNLEDNNASWGNVREHYYQALVAGDEGEYVATFTGLGQLMHLISDMAVPAHVRDDAHLENVFSSVFPIIHFEVWAKKNIGYLQENIFPLDAINPGQDLFANPVVNDAAPAPISALWDIHEHDIADPDIDITLEPIIGLAEYTNANFFSEGTVLTDEYFPDPVRIEKKAVLIADPFAVGEMVEREYWLKKATETTSSYRLAGVNAHTYWTEAEGLEGFGAFESFPIMDKYVFDDYAKLLIPRAVGYSTALLDYFFRGEITFLPADDSFYSLNQTLEQGFTGFKFRVQNLSEEEMLNGSIELVVKYRYSAGDRGEPEVALTEAPEVGPFYYAPIVEENGIRAIPIDAPVELNFDLTHQPIPLWGDGDVLQIVYRGDLGNEIGNAVAVGATVIKENINVSLSDDGFYGLMKDSDQGFSAIKLKAQNIGVNAELRDGAIGLVVKYRLASVDPLVNSDLYPDIPDDFYYMVTPEQDGVRSLLADAPVELNFDLTNNPIPLWATDVYLQVIYQGEVVSQVVDEEGQPLPEKVDFGIVIGTKDISEPTPVDLYNNMDKVCLGGQWYDAGSVAAVFYVDHLSALDGNSDGIADEWDVYPHNLIDSYYRFFPKDQPTAWASDQEGEYHHYLERVDVRGYDRSLYILTDYEGYGYTIYALSEQIDSADPWNHHYHSEAKITIPIMNQLVWVESSLGRYFPLFPEFRGVERWTGFTAVDLPYVADDGVECSFDDLSE